jgi:hypothetical protein
MNSIEFQEAIIKFKLKVGDRVEVKYFDENDLHLSFKLLECDAMNGKSDDYINVDEIENKLDWMEPGYWHIGHIEKIIRKI